MNPHGLPVTNDTLRQMSRYRGREITQEDRAREAMRLIHAEDKNFSALAHVTDLKSSYGDGVTTLVLVYNATGDVLELVDKQDWLGYVYNQEPPSRFENGQWLAFLHAHPTSQALGCEAARVFRGRNIKGEVRDFLIAWSVPWGTTQNSVRRIDFPAYTPTKAYTEVREKDHFPQYWEYIKGSLLERAGKITKDESDQHCASTVSVGGFTTSEFIAVLQHKFSPLPDEN